jgi:hypothetical protein
MLFVQRICSRSRENSWKTKINNSSMCALQTSLLLRQSLHTHTRTRSFARDFVKLDVTQIKASDGRRTGACGGRPPQMHICGKWFLVLQASSSFHGSFHSTKPSSFGYRLLCTSRRVKERWYDSTGKLHPYAAFSVRKPVSSVHMEASLQGARVFTILGKSLQALDMQSFDWVNARLVPPLNGALLLVRIVFCFSHPLTCPCVCCSHPWRLGLQLSVGLTLDGPSSVAVLTGTQALRKTRTC